MKNYKEIAESVLEKREIYETKKKQRRKLVACIAAPICCFAVVAATVFGLHGTEIFTNKPILSDRDAVESSKKDLYNHEKTENSDATNKSDNLPDNNKAADDIFSSGSYCMAGMIIYNETVYLQNPNIEIDEVELNQKIGNGEDFEGTYNAKWLEEKYGKGSALSQPDYIPKSEVYTIKGYDETEYLSVIFENGGGIVLEPIKYDDEGHVIYNPLK